MQKITKKVDLLEQLKNGKILASIRTVGTFTDYEGYSIYNSVNDKEGFAQVDGRAAKAVLNSGEVVEDYSIRNGDWTARRTTFYRLKDEPSRKVVKVYTQEDLNKVFADLCNATDEDTINKLADMISKIRVRIIKQGK